MNEYKINTKVHNYDIRFSLIVYQNEVFRFSHERTWNVPPRLIDLLEEHAKLHLLEEHNSKIFDLINMANMI